jgi:hypothetical protein
MQCALKIKENSVCSDNQRSTNTATYLEIARDNATMLT